MSEDDSKINPPPPKLTLHQGSIYSDANQASLRQTLEQAQASKEAVPVNSAGKIKFTPEEPGSNKGTIECVQQ